MTGVEGAHGGNEAERRTRSAITEGGEGGAGFGEGVCDLHDVSAFDQALGEGLGIGDGAAGGLEGGFGWER